MEKHAASLKNEELLAHLKTAFGSVRHALQRNLPYLLEARDRFAKPGQRVPVEGKPTWTQWVRDNLHVNVRTVQRWLAPPNVESGTADAAKQMALFRHYGDVYRSMEELPITTREGMFIYRLDQLDTTTFYPVLLEVFKRYRNPEYRQEFDQVLLDLESYLVRRAICELTTKNYNDLVVRMIKQLRATDDFSSQPIRNFLMGQTADTGRWPDDDEFRKSWMSMPFYKAIKRSKGRMILEALEIASYHGKTEKVEVERKLTIEHLMPVSWEKHWPIVMNAAESQQVDGAADRRNEAIHRIGNLTLLTKELNPSVSNGPWLKKRDEILKHSALNLNRPFQNISTWDEAAIEQRSAALFEIVKKIWPRVTVAEVAVA